MRTRIITTGMLALSFITVAGTGAAAPTLYPRPGNRLAEVKNTTTSALLADSQDPNTLYVMPPPSGTASLANTIFSANVGFCAEMKDLQGYSRNLAQRIFAATGEIDSYKSELDNLRIRKGQYDEQAAELKKSSTAVREAEELTDTIEAIERRIDDLRDKREQCADEDAVCRQDLTNEIDSLKEQKAELSKQLQDKRREAGQAMRDYDRLKAKAESVQNQIDDVFALIDQKMAFVAKARNQIWDMYRNFGKLEGGSASVDFDSGWTANVTAVRSENVGFNVVPIQTQDVRVNVALVPGLGADGYLENLPSILRMNINARPFDPNDFTQVLPAVPETVSATVQLSLIGACAQRTPSDFDIEKDAQGLPVYGLTETYQFPSTFRTKVTATANLWKAYSYMKKITTKGGFFSSRTRVKVDEETTGDTFVKIDTFDESGLSREEVRALEDSIKIEVMEDVLRMMAVPQPASSGGISVVPPPPAGAVVVAQGIESTCGWSLYCTGVAWVLRGLHAVFGRSTSEAQFKTKYDYWARRSYDRDAVSMRSGLITFKRR